MGHVDLINMLYKSDLRSFLSYFLKMEVEYDNVKHDIYIGAGQGNLKHFNAKYIGAGIWKSVLVCIASSSNFHGGGRYERHRAQKRKHSSQHTFWIDF